MAKGILVADQWTTNTIVEVTLQPTETVRGDLAKYGLVRYTQGSNPTVYEWEVRIDSNKKLIQSLEVGKTYSVFLRAIHSGKHTGYDWYEIKEIGPKKKFKNADELVRHLSPDFNPELFKPAVKQLEPEPECPKGLREDVLALLDKIVQQDMTPEMEALVMLLSERMADDEGLFV